MSSSKFKRKTAELSVRVDDFGPSTSDHSADKILDPDYWAIRIAKLKRQKIDAGLFAGASASISGSANDMPPEKIFSNCQMWFDGCTIDFRDDTVDAELSSASNLGSLARLHGATVLPAIGKGVTHVIGSSLTLSKTLKELKRESSRLSRRHVYFLKSASFLSPSLRAECFRPAWLIDSIRAGSRLDPTPYSLVKSNQLRLRVDGTKTVTLSSASSTAMQSVADAAP